MVAVAAAAAAAPVAKKAAASPLTPVVLGLGALLLFKGLGELKDAFDFAVDLPGDLAEGTGDFFTGVFTGASREEEIVTIARTPEFPDRIFQLTSPAEREAGDPTRVLGTFETFDRNAVTSVSVEMIEGEPILTVINQNPAVPTADFVVFGPDVPLAQRIGAAVAFDPVQDLFTEPFFGSFGGPSAQDAASAIGDATTAVKNFFGGLIP